MRRFCQLVLAVCRTVAASWMDAGGRCAVGVMVAAAVSSACLFFFSCLSYRMKPGEATSSRLVEASRFSSRLASRLFRLVLRLVYSVSVCVSLGRLAFCLVSVSL